MTVVMPLRLIPTGMDNPNQPLKQNPPDFMSGGPHPMPNMPGQSGEYNLGIPGGGRRTPPNYLNDVIGTEIKPGPGYFNDLVNRGGPPLSDEMRRKINESHSFTSWSR